MRGMCHIAFKTRSAHVASSQRQPRCYDTLGHRCDATAGYTVRLHTKASVHMEAERGIDEKALTDLVREKVERVA